MQRKHAYMRIVRNKAVARRWAAQEVPVKVSRRGFLVSSGAAVALRAVPQVARPGGRRILTLVYDKGLGMMRAVERVVP